MPFSNYKTGTFTYDPEQQLYLVEEYGEPYIDGDTGEQVGVTNLVVVQTACRNTGDSLGHITVDLSGSGEGYFACGGKIVPITWSKQAPTGSFTTTAPTARPSPSARAGPMSVSYLWTGRSPGRRERGPAAP